jgi:predicted unusual protein kinase regulating ubiquinone biosynthesis (AarF/ABC1/UbiB family)
VVSAQPPSRVSARERVARARRIGTTFGRVYLGIRAQRFVARRLRPRDMDERWRRLHRSSADAIYEAAVELRGLILKGCQFLGSRADVLPREYVEVLSKLQDRVPPRETAVMRRCVERELGRPLDVLFAWFSPQPIAAASLAQVHEARLHDGRRVAVKIQYPEIAALVRSDLSNLRFLFRAIGIVERDVELMPLIDELATYVPRELNFVNEGRNAETVGRFFAGRDDLAVPRIHWELTTRRVLVMDFVEGIRISEREALCAAGFDPERVAQLLVEAYCEQLLRHGFFHADPHPGNLLVQRSASGGPRLVFLDFGLAKDLPPGFRRGVVAFAAALLRGDAEQMGHALVDLGFETRTGDPEALVGITREILAIAIRFQQRSYLDRELLDAAGRDLAERIRTDPVVRIPGHVVLIARVLGLLSGVSHSLGSRVDLLRTLLPYALAPAPRGGAETR